MIGTRTLLLAAWAERSTSCRDGATCYPSHSSRIRPDDGKLDIGAYEFRAGGGE